MVRNNHMIGTGIRLPFTAPRSSRSFMLQLSLNNGAQRRQNDSALIPVLTQGLSLYVVLNNIRTTSEIHAIKSSV